MQSSTSAMTAAPGATQSFPFLDLKAQFATIRSEILAAVARVFETQQFIMGPEVDIFEEEVKPFLGCRYAFGCASGSDALLLALMALGVGPGDEVITTPFTFVATAGAIARLHARPVFVDIEPDTYNLDSDRVAQAITPRSKAIIPVHLFGLAADMDSILELAAKHNLGVIEDAAQAIGAEYRGKLVGSMGTMGCFSFFPSKNLGAAGDGGLITTNDRELAEKVRMLRVHGSRHKYEYELLGVNSRLDSLQAAILRIKLRHLQEWTVRRQHNADRYGALFAQQGLDGRVLLPRVPRDCVHVYNQFTVRVQYRDRLKEHLANQGIPSEIYYPHPLHLQPAFGYLRYRAGDIPRAEAASAEVLSLPIFPELTEIQLQAVVSAVSVFYNAE
jgi:dTDP-4-amino-4,6-dideoxygalactose transaminase